MSTGHFWFLFVFDLVGEQPEIFVSVRTQTGPDLPQEFSSVITVGPDSYGGFYSHTWSSFSNSVQEVTIISLTSHKTTDVSWTNTVASSWIWVRFLVWFDLQSWNQQFVSSVFRFLASRTRGNLNDQQKTSQRLSERSFLWEIVVQVWT